MTIKFENHEKTLLKLAGKFNQKYPSIPLDDFISEGMGLFVLCSNRYNAKINNGACFNTYFYSSCRGFFRGMAQKHIQQVAVSQSHRKVRSFDLGHDFEIEEEDMTTPELQNHLTPERQTIFKDMLQKMSEDAVYIVNLVLNPPDDLMEINRTTLRSHLRKIWHGDEIQTRISASFQEVTMALKTL